MESRCRRDYARNNGIRNFRSRLGNRLEWEKTKNDRTTEKDTDEQTKPETRGRPLSLVALNENVNQQKGPDLVA